jgi:hypothetical protein
MAVTRKTFSVKIRTRLSYDELDNLCGQYCRAPYSIHLGGLDTTTKIACKLMLIACTDPVDRDRVKAVFAMRGAHVNKSGTATGVPANSDNDAPPDRAA